MPHTPGTRRSGWARIALGVAATWLLCGAWPATVALRGWWRRTRG